MRDYLTSSNHDSGACIHSSRGFGSALLHLYVTLSAGSRKYTSCLILAWMGDGMSDEMVCVCVGSWRRMRVDGDMTLMMMMMMTTGSISAKRRV